MFTLLLAATLHVVAPATVSASGPGDRWFGPDKVKHFFVSAFIQSVSYSALRAADANHGTSLAGASAVTAVFALGKEEHDRRARGEFSVRDLIWDGAGAGAATLLLSRTRR